MLSPKRIAAFIEFLDQHMKAGLCMGSKSNLRFAKKIAEELLVCRARKKIK